MGLVLMVIAVVMMLFSAALAVALFEVRATTRRDFDEVYARLNRLSAAPAPAPMPPEQAPLVSKLQQERFTHDVVIEAERATIGLDNRRAQAAVAVRAYLFELAPGTRLVDVTLDDDPIHTRKTREAPPPEDMECEPYDPDGDRTTIFCAAKAPESSAGLRATMPVRRSG